MLLLYFVLGSNNIHMTCSKFVRFNTEFVNKLYWCSKILFVLAVVDLRIWLFVCRVGEKIY